MPERHLLTSTAHETKETAAIVSKWYEIPVNYIRVLKPKETLLLVFIGICSAFIAAGGRPPALEFALVSLAVTIGSGAANGLTNYFDRRIDAKMVRTQHRVLAAGLIRPAEKALAWVVLLMAVALGLAWYLHPYAFVAGSVALLAALAWRKTWSTHYLGAVASIGPLLVAWLSMRPQLDVNIVLLALVVMFWVPTHVWNLMISWREDYLQAGVSIFPLNRGLRLTSAVSLAFSVATLVAVVLLWWLGEFGWPYFALAGPAGAVMVAASVLTLVKHGRAWTMRAFKLSAYPFLGMTFLGLVIDTWLRMGS